MSRYVLIIGNKNYSSWSLRPWILMKQAAIPFEERRIALNRYESKAQIAEDLNEQHPELGLWPADSAARAHARSISAEMHSGFTALRSSMSMNCRRSLPGTAAC